MNAFTVTAIGRDHPGIVATLTHALATLGCNIEDSTMSVLRGNFAVMLVLRAPEAVDRESLDAALQPVAVGHGLVVDVCTAPVDETPMLAGPTWTVSVHGADRPGIVHGVTSELAGWGANIVDLTTRVVGSEEAPLYVMALDVSVPAETDIEAMRSALADRARDLGVECHVHPSEPDLM